ncbi:MAG: protease modulator HflC [Gammaproteobacteria bacterium]
MKFLRIFGIPLLIVFLIVLFTSVYIVREGQSAIVLFLGKISTDSQGVEKIEGPGLHFKVPVLSVVRKMDTRVQGFTSEPFSSLTSKQTFLEVDYYVKWRIKNLALYYTRTGGRSSHAESLMEPKINDIIRALFGKHTSDQIISTQRTDIMEEVKERAAQLILEDYGIEVLDVRLEVVRLPKRVMQSVFKRMASERKQFANNKRAEGLKVSEGIKSLADQKTVVIKATAKQQAADVKARGDREAAKIYANAYGKDPSFYAFYRSLQAYQSSFKSKNDILVLKPEGQFFEYFNKLQKNK